MPEVEHRNSQLQDVNIKQRLVDLIAVPWEQEAEVFWRDAVWRETFDRHAFDGIQDHAGRVLVNREHRKGETVGKVVQLDPTHRDGLFARVKVFPTVKGDETLTLAEEGGAFPSIGFRVQRGSDMLLDQRKKLRRILRGYMDHLAMVEDPAYVGAEVLAVRAASSGLVAAIGPLPATPLLDEFAHDPLFEWANTRLVERK